MELLVQGARELDILLSPEQTGTFQSYYEELVSWNQRMNLTAIVEYREVQVKHFLDSLTTVSVLPREVTARGRIIDIGSGGGFPGLPIKVAFPGTRLTLLDSVGKKTAFLAHLVDVLGLEKVEVCTGRAEDAALRPQLREGFDVVTSRGVAPMRVLMELTLPYCRVGGLVVTMKKGELEREVEDSLHAIDVLGGALREISNVEVEGLRDGRVLVVVEKVKPTPIKFPRRPGLPAKRPI